LFRFVTNLLIFNFAFIVTSVINNYNNLKEKKQLDKFRNFFQPNEIKVLLSLEYLKPYDGDIKLLEQKSQEYQKLIDEFKLNISITRALDVIEEIISIISDKDSYKTPIENNEEDIFNIIDAFNSLPLSLERELRKLENTNHDYSDHFADNLWEEKDRKEQLLSKNKLNSIVEYENIYCLFSFEIDDLSDELINIIWDSFPLRYFQIELIDNGKNLSELSFGEQQLLFILNQIYTLAIYPKQDLYDYIDAEELAEHGIDSSHPDRFYEIDYIILFDEIDIGFHPDWQKKTIQYIIDFLNATDNQKYYHLIFTTHSPFLLSDIPKENLIFLKDGKQVKGIEKKQTFGANIHTLLSDSFFMEDGLMGEFAKGKIDEVIRLLNKDKLDEKELKYCEQIISIIGEPIVKNQLQRMLDSKRLKKVDEIDAIKKSMEAMQKRLDELEK